MRRSPSRAVSDWLFVIIAALGLISCGAVGPAPVDVKSFGAKGDGVTNEAAAIQRALSSGSAAVEFTPGMYETCATLVLSNNQRMTVILDRGATIQAKPGCGFPTPNWPVLEVSGKSVGVDFRGSGVLDANGVGGKGVQFDPGTSGSVDGLEIENTVGDFSPCINPYGDGEFTVTHTNLHDCLAGVAAYGHSVLHLNENHVMRVGAGLASSGAAYFEANGNKITQASSPSGVLYCFGCDQARWTFNEVSKSATGLHCDTCGGTLIADNTTLDNDGVEPDVFAEMSSCVSVSRNVSMNDSGDSPAIVLGGGDSGVGPQNLRFQVSSLDSIAGLTAGANVMLFLDSNDKQKGAASLVVTTNSNFAVGTLFYQNFTSPQIIWNPFQEIWVKPVGAAVGAGELQLVLSRSANVATSDLVVNLPAAPGDAWSHAVVYAAGWQSSLDGFSGPGGFLSFGIRLMSSRSNFSLKFSDYEDALEILNMSASSNRIVNPRGGCIGAGALQGGRIDGNSCESPSLAGGGRAYVIMNSAGVLFYNNSSTHPSSAPGTFLSVDGRAADSWVVDRGDQTNAATHYDLTNGGKVLFSIPAGWTEPSRAFPPCHPPNAP